MKKGTVLYLTDAINIAEEFDESYALSLLGMTEQWTVVAASKDGWYGVEDAQKLLIERGASIIEAIKGRVGEDGSIEIFGAPLRVYG